MTIDSAELTFRPLIVPTSLDSPEADDFHTMIALRNEVHRQTSGHGDHAVSATELLPHYTPEPYTTRVMWLIDDAHETIGRTGVDLPREAGSRVANAYIDILQAHWGRGIGRAALELVEKTARENGRDTLQIWAEHRTSDAGFVEAPTGFGRVPRDHAARFLEAAGFGLEQVYRYSSLEVAGALDTAQRLLHEAEAASPGYRIVQWEPPTPRELVDGYAWMKSRMSTDAPAADTVVDEEIWDAARVARHDESYLAADRPLIVTAAQHIATGEVCAFNELAPSTTVTGLAHQEDTLVLREHRGHRLGLLVKCAGLLTLHARLPEVTRVTTYNAEENRPMLDINEAMGFTPLSYEGVWKKSLA